MSKPYDTHSFDEQNTEDAAGKGNKKKKKKSIPQRVLEDRAKKSKEGKIPMGSRSYQGKDTRTPWERGGMTKAAYDKLPEKYKKMLQ